MRSLLRSVPVALLVACLSAGAASAVPVTYSFTGTATSTSGVWAGQGSAVTGFYTLDPSNLTVDSYPADASFDQWWSSMNPSAVWEISVSLGTVTRTSADNALAPGSVHHFLEAVDSTDDRWRLEAQRIAISDDFIRLMTRDFTPGPPDAIAVGTGNLNTVPILEPNVLLSDTVAGQSVAEAWSPGGSILGIMTFTLDSVTLVPEPATGALLGLGLAALAAHRRGQRAQDTRAPR